MNIFVAWGLNCDYYSNSNGEERSILDRSSHHGRAGLRVWRGQDVERFGQQREYESELCAAGPREIVESGISENDDRKDGGVLAGEGREENFVAGYLQSRGRAGGYRDTRLQRAKGLPGELPNQDGAGTGLGKDAEIDGGKPGTHQPGGDCF